ncbi:Mediator of RNA polymerase II transcription subunit like [Heracleum sosnowskyi]|uniref:Mediator of RNA polymerase II transcription subunit like n=1 Tax=Heracleum sosnowskyi TaxID=360622 RepID=A0AAD8MH80_9APIA|nr:Mediator of RNA polymerase II transcription subunit like [Heracleum sosnowskyi]
MNLEKKRFQFLLFVLAVVVLSITAEKCRYMVGESASSKSGKFTLFDCFDWSTGSLACTLKEGVKLYTNNIRADHVELVRHNSFKNALVDAASQGMSGKEAKKRAQEEGARAAKIAARNANRILGPIISSGWDFFEAIYYGGTMTEGFLRGGGTLVGTYAVAFLGERRFGRFGYLIGSLLGSWLGGRIGLMLYDIVNGVHYLIQFT